MKLCFSIFLCIFPLLLQKTGDMQTSTKEETKATSSTNHVTPVLDTVYAVLSRQIIGPRCTYCFRNGSQHLM